MSSPKLLQRSSRFDFSGRLPKFLSGPPIAFTDSANDNFMRFFFNLLSSSSHNADLFKKTIGDISKHFEEVKICYCDASTTPIARQCYTEPSVHAKWKEYSQQLEQNRKDLPAYVSKNPGVMVLLALLSRALMNDQFVGAKTYTQAIEDEVAFKYLGSKFGYRLEQVDSLYQFTGKVADFNIQIGFQLLGGNHSDVVEVLKFRSQAPDLTAKQSSMDDFDEGTKSIEVETAFQPEQNRAKKNSKWQKVRQSIGYLAKVMPQAAMDEAESPSGAMRYSPEKEISPKRGEQSTAAKESEVASRPKLPEKRFDYLNAHERPLARESDYNTRYRM